jgi:hypothetical protein
MPDAVRFCGHQALDIAPRRPTSTVDLSAAIGDHTHRIGQHRPITQLRQTV